MKRLAPFALVLVLAACGGSSPHKASNTSAARGSPPPSTPTGATTTATTPASTTTAQAGPLPCRASALSLSFLGGQAATGHGLLGFALRNTGATTCHTYGFPGVLFLDRSGGPLPTEPTHTTQDFFGPAPKELLTVGPGQSVSFRLGVTHGVNSTAGCTTAYGLQVIPPDDTATLRVDIANGAYECRTVTVSPLRPGTSAYP